MLTTNPKDLMWKKIERQLMREIMCDNEISDIIKATVEEFVNCGNYNSIININHKRVSSSKYYMMKTIILQNISENKILSDYDKNIIDNVLRKRIETYTKTIFEKIFQFFKINQLVYVGDIIYQKENNNVLQ